MPEKWENVSYEHHKTKAKASKRMKTIKRNTEGHWGKSAAKFRIKKTTGRSKPWKKKTSGYQIQFKATKKKRKKRAKK